MGRNVVLALLAFGVLLFGCASGGGQETASLGEGNAVPADIKQAAGVLVAGVADVPEGVLYKFDYNGEPAILVNFGGSYQAYVNKCPHQQAQFKEDSLINERIQCPLHGATYNPVNGSYLGHANGKNFGLGPLTMIRVSVQDGRIYAG